MQKIVVGNAPGIVTFSAAVEAGDFGGTRALVVRHFNLDSVAKKRALIVFGDSLLSGAIVGEAL